MVNVLLLAFLGTEISSPIVPLINHIAAIALDITCRIPLIANSKCSCHRNESE